MSETLLVFNHGSGGHRAKLVVRAGVGPAPPITIHKGSADAICLACDWVFKTLGVNRPYPAISWTIVQAAPADVVPTDVDGYSVFGAFAAAFLQACARKGIECSDKMRGGSHSLLRMIRSVGLHTVAISTETDGQEGHFSHVGEIEEKLTRLTYPGLRDPACVLAWNQKRPFWRIEQLEGTKWVKVPADEAPNATPQLYERWHVPFAKTALPIIRAHDAMDAMVRIFELQRRSAGAEVLPL